MEIGAWLEALGLQRYADTFRTNDIDLGILPHLTEGDLEKIGVASLGARKQILIAARGSPGPVAPGQRARGPRSGAERRQLTVMFVDLVGSTALASQFDPEDMSDLLKRYQDVVAGGTSRFEGHVAKFMGDGVLCYFGWPRAQEDMAERAVRSALEIAAQVGQIAASDGRALSCRIGIATGLVVVGELIGSGVSREETVVGETPNLAARLQALADPGGIILSDATHSLVAGVFDADPPRRAAVKGIEGTVRMHSVRGEREQESRFEARSGPRPGHLVGRDDELALLRQALEEASRGSGQGVLLLGEGGIGKSRLVRALLGTAQRSNMRAIQWQCSPFQVANPLWPVVQALSREAGLMAAANDRDKLERLCALPGLSRDESEVVQLMASLLEIDRHAGLEQRLGPQAIRRRTLDLLIDRSICLARERPLLVVCEDAHWIDPSTEELLQRMLDRVQGVPLLLVVTSRHERAPALGAHVPVLRLALERLPHSSGQTIVNGIARGTLSPGVVREIVERSDGVPLFIEELTKAVLDGGQADVPASLHDSLISRLDRAEDSKEVAQIASCIGRSFDVAMLSRVTDVADSTLDAALGRLLASELIYRSTEDDGRTYVFKHALVRDAAHSSLLKSRRSRLHVRIAEVMRYDFPHLADTEPETLAHHYVEAGEAEPAIDYLLKAAERATTKAANLEATRYLERALVLVSDLPRSPPRQQRELEILSLLGRAHVALHGHGSAEARSCYERASTLLAEDGAGVEGLPVFIGMTVVRAVSGNLDEALGMAHRLEALAGFDEGNMVHRINAHYARGITHQWRGEITQAHASLSQGAALYDTSQHEHHLALLGQDTGVVCLCRNSAALWSLGDVPAAKAEMAAAVNLAESLGHPFTNSYLNHWVCWLALSAGDLEAAQEAVERSLVLAAAQGFGMRLGMAKVHQGWLSIHLGHDRRARDHLIEGLDMVRSSGALVYEPFALGLIGRTETTLGSPERAIEAIDAALLACGRTKARWCEAELRRWRAAAKRSKGSDAWSVEADLLDAREVARAAGARFYEGRALHDLAAMKAETSGPDEAIAILDIALERFAPDRESVEVRQALELRALLSA